MGGMGGSKKHKKSPGKLTFGGGEFWKPEVAETPRHEARRLFFESVQKVEPQVLTDLQKYIVPLFRKWRGKPSLEGVGLPERAGDAVAQALLKKPSFPEWFVSWLRCYHLDTPWAREFALNTLSCWKSGASTTVWHIPVRPMPVEEKIDRRFSYVHKTPRLTIATKAEAEAAMYADFLAQREIFLEKLFRDYEEAGYRRTPQKNVKTADDHFRWLAEYQIKRESYDTIRKRWEKNSTPQMVERAVKRLAAFLDLPLRPRSTREIDWLTVSFPPYRKRRETWENGK